MICHRKWIQRPRFPIRREHFGCKPTFKGILSKLVKKQKLNYVHCYCHSIRRPLIHQRTCVTSPAVAKMRTTLLNHYRGVAVYGRMNAARKQKSVRQIVIYCPFSWLIWRRINDAEPQTATGSAPEPKPKRFSDVSNAYHIRDLSGRGGRWRERCVAAVYWHTLCRLMRFRRQIVRWWRHNMIGRDDQHARDVNIIALTPQQVMTMVTMMIFAMGITRVPRGPAPQSPILGKKILKFCVVYTHTAHTPSTEAL